MENTEKVKIIKTIIRREKLRPLKRLARLFKDPLLAFPYYILSTIGHIKPYKLSFKTLWGDTMTGYLPEVNTFYYYGYCEANLTSFLLRFLQPGTTFIDVGAHIGFYSVLSSQLVGAKGKVYSFEPTPWTCKLLQKNTGNLKNVRTNNVGASEIKGEVTFSDYGPGYGAYNSAGAEWPGLRFLPKKVTAEMIQLDSFFQQNSIKPDFIKLDAEGLEFKILNGLAETLKDSRPLITLEMAGDEQWSENCQKSSTTLFESGYESYEMSDDGFVKKCEIKKTYTYTNILFVPKEKTNLISYLIR
ncbi:MAG: FkbM family methyltransferase [Candidatus Vogelbacteria bacterium]|nr:FkbM family methyltransferase [Candidatus Vogelbacteria bacterium]